jgi:hypothetical protein
LAGKLFRELHHRSAMVKRLEQLAKISAQLGDR